MNPVESRPLRYFVAVAEELNFTRAAQRVGIASPALSRAISGLESQLGVRLFERSTRRVTLTEAGTALLTDARAALVALDAATQRARRAAGVAGGKLVLAVKADVEGGLLEDVLAAYRAEHAAVPIEVMFTGWREQPGLLRTGEADVAIVVEPFDSAGLDAEPLLTEPQVLALPTGHPLAERPRLRLADIEAGHQQVGPGSHVYVRHGAQRPQFGDMVQMLRHIELGRMLALFPVSLAERNARPQLTWRPVDDAPEAAFAVAWPQNSQSLAVAAFVRVATAVSAGRNRSDQPAPRTSAPV
jgi:DNA-binding transcriptional LysR family regulator